MNKLLKHINKLFFILFLGVLSSCAGGGGVSVDQPTAPNLLSREGEEEEYELIIMDPGYQSWIAAYAKPMGYYSPAYYENQNLQYVAAWNEKVGQQAYYNSANYPFENRIDYQAHIDYGLELNYELYWYFRYIEHLYGDRFNFPGVAMR